MGNRRPNSLNFATTTTLVYTLTLLWIIFSSAKSGLYCVHHKYVPHKYLSPWLCWLTDPLTFFGTVSIAASSPVCCPESMSRPRLWNGSKCRPHSSWTTPNILSKLSHRCIFGHLWAIAHQIFNFQSTNGQDHVVASSVVSSYRPSLGI